jgi:hypothetical protein
MSTVIDKEVIDTIDVLLSALPDHMVGDTTKMAEFVAEAATLAGSEQTAAWWSTRATIYLEALSRGAAAEAAAVVPKYQHAHILADAYASTAASLDGFPSTPLE